MAASDARTVLERLDAVQRRLVALAERGIDGGALTGRIAAARELVREGRLPDAEAVAEEVESMVRRLGQGGTDTHRRSGTYRIPTPAPAAVAPAPAGEPQATPPADLASLVESAVGRALAEHQRRGDPRLEARFSALEQRLVELETPRPAAAPAISEERVAEMVGRAVAASVGGLPTKADFEQVRDGLRADLEWHIEKAAAEHGWVNLTDVQATIRSADQGAGTGHSEPGFARLEATLAEFVRQTQTQQERLMAALRERSERATTSVTRNWANDRSQLPPSIQAAAKAAGQPATGIEPKHQQPGTARAAKQAPPADAASLDALGIEIPTAAFRAMTMPMTSATVRTPAPAPASPPSSQASASSEESGHRPAVHAPPETDGALAPVAAAATPLAADPPPRLVEQGTGMITKQDMFSVFSRDEGAHFGAFDPLGDDGDATETRPRPQAPASEPNTASELMREVAEATQSSRLPKPVRDAITQVPATAAPSAQPGTARIDLLAESAMEAIPDQGDQPRPEVPYDDDRRPAAIPEAVMVKAGSAGPAAATLLPTADLAPDQPHGRERITDLVAAEVQRQLERAPAGSNTLDQAATTPVAAAKSSDEPHLAERLASAEAELERLRGQAADQPDAAAIEAAIEARVAARVDALIAERMAHAGPPHPGTGRIGREDLVAAITAAVERTRPAAPAGDAVATPAAIAKAMQDPQVQQELFAALACEIAMRPSALGALTGLRAFLREEVALAAAQTAPRPATGATSVARQAPPEPATAASGDALHIA